MKQISEIENITIKIIWEKLNKDITMNLADSAFVSMFKVWLRLRHLGFRPSKRGIVANSSKYSLFWFFVNIVASKHLLKMETKEKL